MGTSQRSGLFSQNHLQASILCRSTLCQSNLCLSIQRTYNPLFWLLVLVFLCMPFSVVAETGLIAYWPMSEGESTTTADASGNGNTGTLINGPLWTSDPGLNFDGLDDYMDVGSLDVAGSSITLAARFRADNLSNCSSRDCRIISKALGTSSQDHYFMVSTIKSGTITRLRFRLKTDGSTTTLIATSGDIVDNEWVHVTAVYDGSEMQLYKDGIEVGIMAKNGSISQNSGVSVWIGGNPPGEASRPWDGQIDEVRIYDRALTAPEIQTLAAGASQQLVAVDDPNAATTLEGTPVTTIDVLANDYLIDNAIISAFDPVSANNGAVFDNGDGTFLYTPATGYSGTDSFTYTLTDDNAESSSAVVTITVTAIDSGSPVAVDDVGAATTPENTAVTTINVLINDTLIDNAVISVFDMFSVNNGSVTYGGDGTFLYTPAEGYNGEDSFTYTLIDDDLETSTAMVSVTVHSVNSGLPVAMDDLFAATTQVDTTVNTFNVLTNDTLVDGAVISTFDSTTVNGGIVENNNDGTFLYTPADAFSGDDSFTYTLTDDDQESSTATVFVTVVSSSVGLVAYWPMEEGENTTTADASGNGHTGTLLNGTLWTVEPGLNFDGIDDLVGVGTLDISGTSITLAARFRADNLSNCSSHDCRIISKAVGKKTQDHYFMVSTVKSGTTTRLRFRLKTGGSTTTLIATSGNIVDNEWVHVSAVYDGSEMRLFKDGINVGNKTKSGSITTNPDAMLWIGGNPPDATSRPWDGQIDEVRVYSRALTEQEVQELAAGASQKLLAVDDPDGATTLEGTPVTTIDVLANDLLFANAVISAFDVVSVNGGVVFDNGDGTFLYTPATGFSGSDAFTYTLTGDNAEWSVATVTVIVTAIDNGSPVAVDDVDAATTPEDTAVTTTNVLANDTLTDNAVISAFDMFSTNNGLVAYNGDGTFLYTPVGGFHGADSFTYTLIDDDMETSSATVTIMVSSVNSGLPIAVDDLSAATTQIDTTVSTINVLTNDTLVDGAVISTFDSTSVNGGIVENNDDGTFLYTPSGGFSGDDSFTYTITDDDQESSIATVFVNVISSSVGLVAYWPMEEGADTTTADASGNGYMGTLVNGPLWTAEPGLSFDGVDDYVDVGTIDMAGAEITLSARFQANNLSNCRSHDCRIISKAVGNATQDHYFMVSTIVDGSLTRLRFRLKTAGYTTTLIASAGNIVENEWVHVVAVYDGSMMRLYQDGIEVGNTAKSGSVSLNSSASVWIGANPPIASSRPWSGLIDEVHIYDRALNVQEIQQLVLGNLQPVAVDDPDAAITPEGTPVTTINVLTNDTLADNAAISSFDVVSANNGSVSDNGDGTFLYTPVSGFSGQDTFTYTLTDDDFESDIATVTVTVIRSNEPPEIVQIIPDQLATEADEYGPLDVASSFFDPDGDALSYSLGGLPIDTGLTIDQSIGMVSGEPSDADAQAAQPILVIVTADDGFGGSVQTAFNLSVTDVNQAPQVLNSIGGVSVTESIAFGPFDISGYFYDPDGDTLNYTMFGLPLGSGLSINSVTGEIEGTPTTEDAQAVQPINIQIIANDGLGGEVSTGFDLSVNANDAPLISITSHSYGDSVSVGGFLLSGNVMDGDGISSLIVSLNDPLLGSTVDQKMLDYADSSGGWHLPVFNGLVSLGEMVSITLTATDVNNKSSSQFIDLQVVVPDNSVHHAINRLTFGATPELLDRVRLMGSANFLAEQLSPATIDDSSLEALIAGINVVSIADLQQYQLLYAIHSQRQLKEVMTWFWDNHFSTDVNKHGNVQYELDEHNQFRANALGNFRDLLEISAKSPAMLEFLDGVSNVKASPNENYARELMELHTLGVSGGYSQADVEEVARAFTGWTIQSEQFFFDATQHDANPMTVLGQAISVGGVGDGEQVLDLLVNQTSTASFVCAKLVALFVADTAPASLVSECSTVFQNTITEGNQIEQVLNAILSSAEFNSSSAYHDKVKIPIEFVVGAIRQLESTGPFDNLSGVLETMGLPLFENHIPTGYPETGDNWINSNLLLEHFKFVNHLALSVSGGSSARIDPITFFSQHGYETADGVIWYLFELTLGGDFTLLEWNIALDVLTSGGAADFDINAPDAEAKLRRLIGTVLSLPSYQEQ